MMVTCDSHVIVHHRPEEAGVSVNDQHHLTRMPRLPLEQKGLQFNVTIPHVCKVTDS